MHFSLELGESTFSLYDLSLTTENITGLVAVPIDRRFGVWIRFNVEIRPSTDTEDIRQTIILANS